jgi:hypothetical protein
MPGRSYTQTLAIINVIIERNSTEVTKQMLSFQPKKLQMGAIVTF